MYVPILTASIIVCVNVRQCGLSERRMRIQAGQRHGVVCVDGGRHAVDAAQQLTAHQRHHATHWTDVEQIRIIEQVFMAI